MNKLPTYVSVLFAVLVLQGCAKVASVSERRPVLGPAAASGDEGRGILYLHGRGT